MKRVLIVKLSAIGDVVESMPMLTHLRASENEVHITWVCGKIVAPLLEATGLVDRIIEVDELKLFKGNFFSKIAQLLTVWKRLALNAYDLIITAHADPRYRSIALFSRAKKRRSFVRNGDRRFPVPGRSRSAEYLRLLTDAEEPNTLSIQFPRLKLSKQFSLDQPTIALAPGGAKNVLNEQILRRWPIENYVVVAKELKKRGYRVILTGAETDSWVSEHFPQEVAENWIGKTTLLGLVSLYQSCKLLITHDSGPLHLAKLADCPVIALFGPTNPSEAASPQQKVLWGGAHLSCRPCYDGKTFAPCKNNLCMATITPSKVLEIVDLFHNLPAPIK